MRKDIPVSLPFNSGMILPTAFAAPVVEGIMLPAEARPNRQSFSSEHRPYADWLS